MKKILPDWFILQAPPDLSINIHSLKQKALDRADFLEKFTRETPTVPEDSSSLFLGSFLLLLSAALSLPVRSWIVEKEGDYFDYRFKSEHEYHVKINIIAELLHKTKINEKTIISHSEFLNIYNGPYLDDLKHLIHEVIIFRAVLLPSALAEKVLFLFDGWAVVEIRFLYSFIKRQFETILRQKIDHYRSLLDNGSTPMVKASTAILTLLQDRYIQIDPSQSYEKDILIHDILNKHTYLPPCIRSLVNQMETRRYLPDRDRLQLGLFLKNVGMSLEEQLEYWWAMSADNIGITRDQWNRTHAQRIEHLYGERGSRTDYQAISCSTSASTYFCPFAQLNNQRLRVFLKELYGEGDDEEILRQSNFRNYQRACMSLWKKLNNVKSKKLDIIYYPLNWAGLSSRKQTTNK